MKGIEDTDRRSNNEHLHIITSSFTLFLKKQRVLCHTEGQQSSPYSISEGFKVVKTRRAVLKCIIIIALLTTHDDHDTHESSRKNLNKNRRV